MSSYDYIVSQMSIRSFDEMPRQYPERKSPDLEKYQQKGTNSLNKNPYIGLTLMEYFKLSNSKQGLQEIDEESNSSISAGTPCFGDCKEQTSEVPEPKKNRRDKLRISTEEALLPILKESGDAPHPKISTIILEENIILDKNIVKLPSINDYRHTNNSRQGMIKEGKIVNPKKEHYNKYKNDQSTPNSLNKYNEIGRIHQVQKNHQFAKKSIRARVTSTSFYHMGTMKERQRERIKTEEEIPERNLQKSFIVTKYGVSFASKKTRDDSVFQPLKKHENTIKLLKYANN